MGEGEKKRKEGERGTQDGLRRKQCEKIGLRKKVELAVEDGKGAGRQREERDGAGG